MWLGLVVGVNDLGVWLHPALADDRSTSEYCSLRVAVMMMMMMMMLKCHELRFLQCRCPKGQKSAARLEVGSEDWGFVVCRWGII